MKKFNIFLFAAIGIMTVASCERAEMAEPVVLAQSGETTTLTLQFDATKTALVDGKTKWLAGDKVRIYSSAGTYYEDVEISEDQVGKESAEVVISMKDTTFYAVYPIESAEGVSGGSLRVSLPSNADGLFESANICAGKTEKNGTSVTLSNLASIMKINVSSGNVVEILQFNAKNAMTGVYSVDFSAGAPSLTAVTASKSATVAIGGVDGDYYVAVAPGTYAEEFSVTALRGNGGYQTVTSSRANEIVRNQIVSLGTIGNNLSDGLKGEGSEASPYVISNLGEFGAFSASVNLGNPYTGKFVSLETDIEEPVASPIGYYISADVQFPFAGVFLGNNHSIKLDLEGENCKSQNYVALFGVVDAGATIKDLKISGSVNATGNYTAGLAGYLRGSSDKRITIDNITNDVVVESAGSRVAGVAAYASYSDITNCANHGKISGTNCVGGVSGYAYYTNFERVENTEEVTSKATDPTGLLLPYYQYYSIDDLNNKANGTWTNGTGGIAGYIQNSSVDYGTNSGAVSAYSKIGGIVGVGYWANVTNCQNSAVIEASGNQIVRADSQYGYQWGSVVAGIAGWIHVYGVVTDCTNTGAVSGVGGVGGIVSLASCGNNAISAIKIANCINTADLTGNGSYSGGTSSCANVGAGGICAATSAYTYWGSGSANPRYVTIEKCINRGNVTVSNSSGSADATGGIVGNIYDPNYQNGKSVYINDGARINDCINEGNITADYYVGGIVGLIGSRYAQQPRITNCVNRGKVTSNNYSVKYSGILIGGLVGGVMAYNTSFRSRVQFHIYNNYSSGDVVFTSGVCATPYLGGLIGSTWGGGYFANNYLSGNVVTSTGAAPTETELQALGAIVGYQNADVVKNSYYPQGVLGGVAISKKSAVTTNDSLAAFDDKYEFAGVVTYEDKDYESLLDILNAWVGGSTDYFKWKSGSNGPEFDI